jgi:predicted DNA-binding transcriptional regulator YafY
MESSEIKKIFKTIDDLLRLQGSSPAQIAKKYDISRSAGYRYIKTIRELGYKVTVTRNDENKAVYRINPEGLITFGTVKLPDEFFSAKECIILSSMLKSDDTLFNSGYQTILNSFRTKIKQKSPATGKISRIMPKIDNIFLSPASFQKDYTGKEDIIENLFIAMVDLKTCKIEYNSFSSETVKEMTVNPLHFLEVDGGLYFICQTDENKIFTLAVERIQKLEDAKKHFTYPEDFNAREYVDTPFRLVHGKETKVKIRFNADQSRYVLERKWAKDQTVKEEADGSVTISFTTSGIFEVKRWVLSWGAAALVLEPKELEQAVKEEIRKMKERY